MRIEIQYHRTIARNAYRIKLLLFLLFLGGVSNMRPTDKVTGVLTAVLPHFAILLQI